MSFAQNISDPEGREPDEGSERPSLLFLFLLSLLCVPILSPPILSGDYFWHIVTGRYILESGQLPSYDIFQAVSDGRPWATFQWLYDVLLALSADHLGALTVRVAHGICGAVAMALWALHLSRRLGTRGQATSRSLLLLMAGIFLFIYADRVRIRPHVVTFAITGALLPFFFEPARPRPRWQLALLPVGLAILANFHAGGALILLAIFSASVVGVLLRVDAGKDMNRRVGGLWLGSALAVLMMPGFLSGIAFGIHSSGTNTAMFTEWQPPTVYFTLHSDSALESVRNIIMGSIGYLISGLLVLGLIVGLIRRGLDELRAMPNLPWVAMGYAAALISIRSARFVPFCILAIPGLLCLWRVALDRRVLAREPGRAGLIASVTAGVLLLMGSHAYLWDAYGMNRHSISDGLKSWVTVSIPKDAYPVLAADYLEERLRTKEGEDPKKPVYLGGVYNDTAHHGSYLLWRLWPHVRVHYDGRGNLKDVDGCDPQKEARSTVGIPCNEADRIMFAKRSTGDPSYRDAVSRIYRESGLRFLLVHSPAFARTRPVVDPNSPRIPWPMPTDYALRVGGPIELWERVVDRP